MSRHKSKLGSRELAGVSRATVRATASALWKKMAYCEVWWYLFSRIESDGMGGEVPSAMGENFYRMDIFKDLSDKDNGDHLTREMLVEMTRGLLILLLIMRRSGSTPVRQPPR
jgi:hypothetical protein